MWIWLDSLFILLGSQSIELLRLQEARAGPRAGQANVAALGRSPRAPVESELVSTVTSDNTFMSSMDIKVP